MKTYIALLRGINVSGHKKIKMADLRTMLEELDFKKVETYIQSGNIVFGSSEKFLHVLEQMIQKEILKTFDFDVPVLVRTYDELKSIFEKNPFTDQVDIEKKQVYFAILKETPAPDLMAAFKKEKFDHEEFLATGNCIYLNCLKGAAEAKLSNNLIERKLKVSATTRNYRTMLKLLEMAG
ncbi:DUF1697 domain-containing protein [Maribacter halichondriae]|uniref:DUF1697 domain-containing protein n=1 Tax=Maribacter halichondriae TaxID=2980554 RepID=UPI002359F0E0|nr:DUF1697 domain-containing protein [Maribacter sp. Hal144]